MGEISARGIGIVGARALPESYRERVSGVARYLLDRGYHIHTGGALGADMYALQSVISCGAYSRAEIFSAWASVSGFPREIQSLIEQYLRHDGRISWGMVQPRSHRGAVVAGLLARNLRLVRSSAGLVAFLYGESRGTTATVMQAAQRGLRVVVFLCGGGAALPRIGGGAWRELRCGGVWRDAYRFVPN